MSIVPLLFIFYVLTSCIGLYLLKMASDWKSLIFVTGAILYGLGAIQWLLILRKLPLSMAFPIASGALMIGTVVTGKILLNEVLTTIHIAGVFFIFLGIALIALYR